MKATQKLIGGMVLTWLWITTSGTGLAQTSLNATGVQSLQKMLDVQLNSFLEALDATPQLSADAVPKFGNFFSLAHPEWPPIPENPNGVPAWHMSGSSDSYLLNDVTVNYSVKKTPTRTMSMNSPSGIGDFSPADSPGDDPSEAALLAWATAVVNLISQVQTTPDVPNDGGGNGNSPIYPPGTLYVNSLTLSNGWLNFDTYNLIPGNTYIIARKTILNNDFRLCWVPEWNFSATDTNQVFSIPCPNDSDMGFYRVVNYDLYQGPSPVITSPADNSTVSGIIQVTCALTDIFPADQASLFVDEINFGTVTNGVASWNLDTSLLANGPHSVDVQFLSEIPIVDDQGSNNIEMWTSDALLYSLTTSNFLAQNVAPRCFTAEFGTVPFAFDTAAP